MHNESAPSIYQGRTCLTALDKAFQMIGNVWAVGQGGDAITLSVLSRVPNITHWKMTLVRPAPGAQGTTGEVIKEADGATISVSKEEYLPYLNVTGPYKVRLDITSDSNKTAAHEFTVWIESL